RCHRREHGIGHRRGRLDEFGFGKRRGLGLLTNDRVRLLALLRAGRRPAALLRFLDRQWLGRSFGFLGDLLLFGGDEERTFDGGLHGLLQRGAVATSPRRRRRFLWSGLFDL